jgi:hypothetical protein
VDVNEALLRETGEALGVPSNHLFTDVAEAFARIEAGLLLHRHAATVSSPGGRAGVQTRHTHPV